jgi:2-aminoethylphosphonate-pyruvate transaminase
MILLNPGPVNLSSRVRSALSNPDLCHREAEFAALQTEIREQLLAVYDLDPEHWAAVLISGSGTAAMEAMISSLVPATGKLLVIENGIYGERLSYMARLHGIACITLPHEWGAAIDMAALEQALSREPGLTQVAVVHHETTTGRLNDLAAIGDLCRHYRIPLLVDGVSSFGAEAIPFPAGEISAVAGTANKCLHGAPGVALVMVHRQALPTSLTPRSLYLDLATYCREQDRHNTPFTPAIPAFYALREALQELAEAGGWQSRRAQYRQLAELVAEGFRALGIEPLLPPEASSAVLRAYRLPANLSYLQLHDALKEQGFVIYAGQGGLVAKIFRVATMGAITAQDMERFVASVGKILTPAS